jgi:phosphopantothenoylcysteine synthetase/decarboxylase
MWEKPVVARNIAQVRADGHHVIEPASVERYDVPTRAVVKAPSLPPPAVVVGVIRKLLAA